MSNPLISALLKPRSFAQFASVVGAIILLAIGGCVCILDRKYPPPSRQKRAKPGRPPSPGDSPYLLRFTPPAKTPAGADDGGVARLQAQADAYLSLAREKWEDGDFDGSVAVAEKALAIVVRLHGDQGEQPDKIRGMIQAAKAKQAGR